MRPSQRDPRSIVTPDAFEVSSKLMGMPLAAPRLRLVALLIDGVVIGIITAVTKSFALILGIVAAALFVRAGFKRTPVKGSVFGRAMRLSVGCLGVVIALITAAIWSAVGFDGNGGNGAPSGAVTAERGGPAAQVMGALAVLGALDVFEGAESIEDAERLGSAFIDAAEDAGLDRSETRSILLAAVPDDPPWSENSVALVDRLLSRGEAPAAAVDLPESVLAELASYTTEESMHAYAQLLAAGQTSDSAIAVRAVLEGRLGPVVAGDTLDALRASIGVLEGDLASRQLALDAATRELEEANGVGLLDRLLGLVDDLGFGFGWAAVYLTVFLSWWNGQTVGKRLMGIRVVRLDGEPVTWWVAFERSGGYAAGLATGLLGFAQVWWDANRQGIHDRIVGTVVVVDGAEPVSDWESAL